MIFFFCENLNKRGAVTTGLDGLSALKFNGLGEESHGHLLGHCQYGTKITIWGWQRLDMCCTGMS